MDRGRTPAARPRASRLTLAPSQARFQRCAARIVARPTVRDTGRDHASARGDRSRRRTCEEAIVSDRADVLIVGAGASGGVVAAQLAQAGMRSSAWSRAAGSTPPTTRLTCASSISRRTRRWHINPNVRGRPQDYPCEVSESDINPLMVAAVGGSTIHYTAIWTRLHGRPTSGAHRRRRRRRLADLLRRAAAALRGDRRRVRARRGSPAIPAYPPGAELPLPAFPLGPAGRAMARRHELARLALVAGRERDALRADRRPPRLPAAGHLPVGLSRGREGVDRHDPLAARPAPWRASRDRRPRPRDHRSTNGDGPPARSTSTATAPSTTCRHRS